jgi:hypothetical protein
MTVPVVFISKTLGGGTSLLPISTECASKNNDVVLLGDEGNKEFCKGEFIPFERYNSGYKEFEELYIHLSTNNPAVEKFCISRWFILRDFMNDNNVEMVFHADWDVLCFADITKDSHRFQHLDCALSARTTGGQSFFSKEGINKVFDYILKLYKNKDSFEFQRLAQNFNLRQKFGLHGGVCDMNFLEHYARYEAHHAVGELSLVSHNPQDYFYELHMGVAEGFESEHGPDGRLRKVYKFKDGIPYSKHLRTGRDIPFATVHFQGSHKHLMEEFYGRSL